MHVNSPVWKVHSLLNWRIKHLSSKSPYDEAEQDYLNIKTAFIFSQKEFPNDPVSIAGSYKLQIPCNKPSGSFLNLTVEIYYIEISNTRFLFSLLRRGYRT